MAGATVLTLLADGDDLVRRLRRPGGLKDSAPPRWMQWAKQESIRLHTAEEEARCTLLSQQAEHLRTKLSQQAADEKEQHMLWETRSEELTLERQEQHILWETRSEELTLELNCEQQAREQLTASAKRASQEQHAQSEALDAEREARDALAARVEQLSADLRCQDAERETKIVATERDLAASLARQEATATQLTMQNQLFLSEFRMSREEVDAAANATKHAEFVSKLEIQRAEEAEMRSQTEKEAQLRTWNEKFETQLVVWQEEARNANHRAESSEKLLETSEIRVQQIEQLRERAVRMEEVATAERSRFHAELVSLKSQHGISASSPTQSNSNSGAATRWGNVANLVKTGTFRSSQEPSFGTASLQDEPRMDEPANELDDQPHRVSSKSSPQGTPRRISGAAHDLDDQPRRMSSKIGSVSPVLTPRSQEETPRRMSVKSSPQGTPRSLEETPRRISSKGSTGSPHSLDSNQGYISESIQARRVSFSPVGAENPLSSQRPAAADEVHIATPAAIAQRRSSELHRSGAGSGASSGPARSASPRSPSRSPRGSISIQEKYFLGEVAAVTRKDSITVKTTESSPSRKSFTHSLASIVEANFVQSENSSVNGDRSPSKTSTSGDGLPITPRSPAKTSTSGDGPPISPRLQSRSPSRTSVSGDGSFGARDTRQHQSVKIGTIETGDISRSSSKTSITVSPKSSPKGDGLPNSAKSPPKGDEGHDEASQSSELKDSKGRSSSPWGPGRGNVMKAPASSLSAAFGAVSVGLNKRHESKEATPASPRQATKSASPRSQGRSSRLTSPSSSGTSPRSSAATEDKPARISHVKGEVFVDSSPSKSQPLSSRERETPHFHSDSKNLPGAILERALHHQPLDHAVVSKPHSTALKSHSSQPSGSRRRSVRFDSAVVRDDSAERKDHGETQPAVIESGDMNNSKKPEASPERRKPPSVSAPPAAESYPAPSPRKEGLSPSSKVSAFHMPAEASPRNSSKESQSTQGSDHRKATVGSSPSQSSNHGKAAVDTAGAVPSPRSSPRSSPRENKSDRKSTGRSRTSPAAQSAPLTPSSETGTPTASSTPAQKSIQRSRSETSAPKSPMGGVPNMNATFLAKIAASSAARKSLK